ncbi:MAG: aspartate-semialdehyde dehydrogenase [Betaproteobacteria bacterium]|nr:MAG: aspartate-semialdehyde dehydrogenase [Betaproteobacteria bacterium]
MSLRVGLVGWRGMVGSVLMQRMSAERDFDTIETTFFSTSSAGKAAPKIEGCKTFDPILQDGNDITKLKGMDVIITCQGGDYTKAVYAPLRAAGWKGYWIDAAKTLRMNDDAIIILDPINMPVIKTALSKGIKDYIGGNCTVSCMMMGVGALYKAGLVEWMQTSTYQAASGGGAANMREMITQYGAIYASVKALLDDPQSAILEIDRIVTAKQNSFTPEETANFRGIPLGGNLIPWIDADRENGTSLEEWKGGAETNKIMGLGKLFGSAEIPIDSTCIRVGAMRCHSQSLTFKLKKNVPLADIEQMIANDNEWVKYVPNNRVDTEKHLTPAVVSGTMTIPVGRVRKLAMGPEYLGAFTVGDQLLWGAAEPLRRMLRILQA